MTELPDEFNPVKAAIDVLDLYRDCCRSEFLMDQLYALGQATATDIRKVQLARKSAVHALVEMFVKLRSRPRVLKQVNGIVCWPEDWTDRRYNSQEPCDVLVGPCSCGAWHDENEDWVVAKLRDHNAVIE